MTIPYIPLGAIAVIAASVIVITLGIVYSIRISKDLEKDDPRLEFHQKLGGFIASIGIIALVVVGVLIGSDEFIDPEKAMKPIPGSLTGLVQEFMLTPFEETSYMNMSIAGCFAGVAALIICLRWWPYAKITKETILEATRTELAPTAETATRRSKKELDPNAGFDVQSPVKTLTTRVLRILVPVLIVTSTLCFFSADHIKNNPTTELITAKKQALITQAAIHEAIYHAFPDETSWVKLFNAPTPYAEDVISESNTSGKHPRPNGQVITFSRIPSTPVRPFIGDSRDGRNANWQTLRWAQAVVYGLKPQATIVYKDGHQAYYEASYDSSGSIVFTPIRSITHRNK